MIGIKVTEADNGHKVDFEAKIIGYDKAVEQLSTLFTVLYKNMPEKILAEALYSSDWGKRINELTKD